jgi:hypothetical protein
MTELTEVTIPQSLIDQQSSLNSTIAQIVAEQSALTTKKAEAENSLLRINKVIAILKGEEVLSPAGGVGTRRPMSEQAKLNIKNGLIAAAARKREAKAASTVSQAPQIDSQESAPAPAPVSPADTKGGKKATK